MNKPTKINSGEYSYNGFSIVKYEKASGAAAWLIENSDGQEMYADISTLKMAVCTVDRFCK